MTYGRPSMTSHLPSVPLPGALDLIPFQESRGPSLMTFYVATVELYHILDCILSEVYHTWRGRSSATPTVKLGALDIIIELEEKLVRYELGLPWFLNWTGRSPSPQSSLGIDPPRRLVLERQRNVLHARYLHIHNHIPGLHIKTDKQQISIPSPPPLPPNLHTSMLRGHTHPLPPPSTSISTSPVTLTSRASTYPRHAPSIHQAEMRRCLCPSRD